MAAIPMGCAPASASCALEGRTPAGLGVFHHPPVFLAAGERVTITIEGLGTLSNPVRAL